MHTAQGQAGEGPGAGDNPDRSAKTADDRVGAEDDEDEREALALRCSTRGQGSPVPCRSRLRS